MTLRVPITDRYVPAHFRDPWGLALRLLRSGSPEAIFAMTAAGLGMAVAPLDALCSPFEHRIYRRAGECTGPLLFICGGPRTGTTLVHQTIAGGLPVARFNNITALFPRSPLIATRLAGRFLGPPSPGYRSFYGRTVGLSGLNDALPIWDRWLGSNRTLAPSTLTNENARDMRRFFAAWTRAAGRPLVGKCNHLNAAAHLVAEALPEAKFICIERNLVWHAQSLLKARELIHGDRRAPYGLTDPKWTPSDDFIESVCQQAIYHHNVAVFQEKRIGADRFWRISYEDFCRAPSVLVCRAAQALFGEKVRGDRRIDIAPHRASENCTVDQATFDRLTTVLAAYESTVPVGARTDELSRQPIGLPLTKAPHAGTPALRSDDRQCKSSFPARTP